MNFKRLPEFEKELKALTKRWPSLPKDLSIAEQVISTLYADQEGVDRTELRKNFFNNKRATILSVKESYEAVKMRIDGASLGSKDCMRLVFVYVYDGVSVVLIEIYSKTDKPCEDAKRLQGFLSDNLTE